MPDIFPHDIKLKVFIEASPEKVYNTITSAEGWNAFFTTDMELDAKPSGAMKWRWKDWGPDLANEEDDGEVIELTPHSRFVFKWGSKNITTVTYDLEPRAGSTVVRLTESGFLNTTRGINSLIATAGGWGEALVLLKFYLEHGIVYTSPKA